MKKKELLLIFLISIVLWFVSGVLAGLLSFLKGFDVTGLSSCLFTGFPIGFCFDDFEKGYFYLWSIINLLIWVVSIIVIWKIYKNLKKKKH